MLWLSVYAVVLMLIVLVALAFNKTDKLSGKIAVILLLLPVLGFSIMSAAGIAIPRVLCVYSAVLVLLCIISTLIKKKPPIGYRIAAAVFFVPVIVLSVLNIVKV